MAKSASAASRSWIEHFHVPTLAAFAVAQPLFDLTARHADFYVAWGSRPLDLLVLALGLGLGLPLALAVLELICGLFGATAKRATRAVLITLLMLLITLPLILRIKALPSPIMLGAALTLGVIFTLVWRRFRAARIFLSLLAPCLLLFPALFLTRGPIRQLLSPSDFPRPSIEIENPVPVVLMIFDEFPLSTLLDERLEIDRRFPHFAALAATAHWFRNATTVSDKTTLAVPAILTGRYPLASDQRPATLKSHPENLFTLLGPAMELSVSEAVTRLCPQEYCGSSPGQTPSAHGTGFLERNIGLYHDLLMIYPHLVTPPRWAVALPRIDETWTGFQAPRQDHKERGRQGDRVQPFLEQLTARPSGFHMLHLVLPHSPWEYLPSGRHYNDRWVVPDWSRRALKGDLKNEDPWTIQLAYQRFLLQVRAVDSWFGKVRSRLEDSGVWDQALVIVVADHGIANWDPRQRRGQEPADFERDIMPIPLLVKLPGQKTGTILDRNVETIDILPTIAEALGIHPPWPVDGESLFSTGPERPSKRYFVAFFNAPQFQPHIAPPTLTSLRETVDWKLEIFGTGETGGTGGTPEAGMFHFGPHRDLVGQALSELDITGSDLQAVLLRSHLYQDVDPDQDFVPAYVLGQIHGAPEPSRHHHLAIAINGTIRAVARTYPEPNGDVLFAAMVAEDSFRRGANDVQILEIDGRGSRRGLTRTETMGHETYRHQRFDALSEGWSFAVPLDQVKPLQMARVTLAHEGAEPVLVIEAEGGDPALEVPLPERPGINYLIVRFEITSPADTDLRIFHRVGEETDFTRHRNTRFALKEGENTVFIELRDRDIRGPLRLDPGARPGTYRIRGLEIRGEAGQS